MVRVRFAPSPTGYLHIGSARCALFNWFYARCQNGKFILRIEDTDIERSEEKYVKDILGSLAWLSIIPDEGPYYQSKRREIYLEYADKLIKKDKAYHKEGAIFFKIPKEIIKFKDLIHSEIEFDNSLQDDLVIIKQDLTPTYNFACVIDDVTMEITHVIRGVDHISNTPKQIPVYQALEFKMPKFAHIPLILGKDRERLSKRHGATSVSEYRSQGYLEEAFVNYLTLLGWAPGEDQEIVTVKQTIKKFSLKAINKTNATFGIDKLNWINSQYIKAYSVDKLLELVLDYPQATEYKLKNKNLNWLKEIVKILQSRMRTISDFFSLGYFFFTDKINYEKEAVEKFFKNPEIFDKLKILKERFEKLTQFTPEQIEKALRDLVSELNIKAADLIHPVRVAVTGKTVSAGLFDILYLLGKEKVINRLGETIEKFSSSLNL